MHNGVDIVSANSMSIQGCILSGPVDLSTFSPLSIFTISSFFTFICSILFLVSFIGKVGTSPSGSFVNTLLKNVAKISAFSLSSSVLQDVSSFWSVNSSPIPDIVLDLDFMYFQIVFGFFF